MIKTQLKQIRFYRPRKISSSEYSVLTFVSHSISDLSANSSQSLSKLLFFYNRYGCYVQNEPNLDKCHWKHALRG